MLRAIVVDDEPMSVKRFSGILTQTGLATLVAAYSDPVEALENVMRDQPDVAFVDIEMPGMNGLSLTEKLQQQLPALEVIMVTAHDQYALEAFRAHAVGYLLKPASLAEVKEQLQALAAKRFHQQQEKFPAALCIRTFGRFQCYLKEASPSYFTWRTTKARELMAFLHHHQGKPVTRDKILDTLWEEMDLDRAVKNFHATSYYLRDMLKQKNLDHLFERINGTYLLHTEDTDSDERSFLQLADTFKKGKAGLRELEELTALYNGDYCSEDDYDWAKEITVQYETIFLQVQEQLYAAYIQDQNWSKAAGVLRRQLTDDPFNEVSHEKLIDLLIIQQDLAGAQRHYDALTHLFQEELGIYPPKKIMEKIKKITEK